MVEEAIFDPGRGAPLPAAVLMALELDQEEAAYTMGASPWRTFRKVLLPTLAPAIATGCLLAFARALGEFGSIVIVAGNFPFRSQTAPVYVLTQIESDHQRAAASRTPGETRTPTRSSAN